MLTGFRTELSRTSSQASLECTRDMHETEMSKRREMEEKAEKKAKDREQQEKAEEKT